MNLIVCKILLTFPTNWEKTAPIPMGARAIFFKHLESHDDLLLQMSAESTEIMFVLPFQNYETM